MWQYGVTDVPGVEPGLNNFFGFGYTNYGFNQPIWGNTPHTVGCNGCGTSTLGYNPFVTPLNFVKTDWNPVVNFQTTWNPFFGLKTDWNPIFTTGYTPFVNPIVNPFGFDKIQMLNTLGINPWQVNSLFGMKLTEEIWKNTLPINTPIYGTPFTPTFPVGVYGTPYGVNTFGYTGYTPYGFNRFDEKLNWGTGIGTGLFGFQTTPWNTPFDWKLKTFTNPVGVTTETWNKTLVPNFSWTTGRVPGPVAVL